MERYDAIVVGSGATGGWAAAELTRAGMRVIVVEAGPRDVPEPFVDAREHPYSVPRDRPYRWTRSRVLGGRTLTWNAVTLRFGERDLAPTDGGRAWPITYAELAPYYDVAERGLRVSGARDHLAQVPDGAFLPPRRMTEGERELASRIEGAWPERRVIIARGALPGPTWRSTTSTLAAANRTGRLTVATNTIVARLDLACGRARGVRCIDRASRRAFGIRGDTIVLCASTIETIRILLASELGGDALGRYVMDHTMIGVAGTMRAVRRRPVAPYRGGPYGIYLPRFRDVGRFGIQGVVQRWPVAVSTERGVPFQLTVFGEVLADRANRVTLDRKTRDAWGLAVPRIACRYGDSERAMIRDQLAVLDELAEVGGLEITERADDVIPGTSIHEVGGARMGTDPQTSVVDRDNRLWAAPNVLVTDGSCFVSAPCQNPTLTMMALTIRACRHLVASRR